MEHIDCNDHASVSDNRDSRSISTSERKHHPSVPALPIPRELTPNQPLRRTRSWRDLSKSPRALLQEISRVTQVSPRSMKNVEKSMPQISGPYISRKPSKEITKVTDQLKVERKVDLSKKFEGKIGYPWEDIAALGDTDLIESLLDLYQLSLKMYHKGSNAESIIMLALDIVHREKDPQPLRIIGMLIDYVASDPQGAAKLSNGKDAHESTEKIKSKFRNRLQTTQDAIKKIYMNHQEAGLQNPEMASIKYIPHEIAKFLIPIQGMINFGIIDDLKETFAKDKNPLNYQINLTYGLTHLRYHYELRNLITKINPPANDKDPGNYVIRASENLSLKDPVTALHAQRTALSGLISHLRQLSTEDSCFTTSIAIELMSFNLGCCAKDFAEILETSKLTRKVDGKLVDFPFMLHMNGESLEAQIKFDRDGRIVENNKKMCFLWEAPGIKMACNSMGIEDSKALIKQLFLIKGGSIIRRQEQIQNLNVRDIFQTLATHIAKKSDLKENELFTLACFNYDSVTTCHPLLRVWENSLAGMSEASETSMTKAAISDSIIRVFREFATLITKIEWKDSDYEKMLLRELQSQCCLLYDPEIGKKSLNGDYPITRGAFVLYQQSPNQNALRRMRIDNSILYQSFLKNILETVIHKIPKHARMEKEKEPYIHFLKQLIKYVDNEQFIARNLECYHKDNRFLIETAHDFEKFRYTPWITRMGNNPKALLKVYYEIDSLPETEIVRPKNEMDLLRKFIDIRRNVSPRTKSNLARNPYYLQPVRRPGMHAFSALAGELVIAPSISTDQWIEQTILKPGREVSAEIIDPGQKDELLKFVLTYFTETSTKFNLEKSIKHISMTSSIKEFREFVLSILHKSEPHNPILNPQFEREFDTKIYLSLRKELRNKLENSAFHVADSNMLEGTKDVRYCFAVNPGTGELSFWACLDDKPLITVLDPKQWLVNQSWEFYRHPQNATESPRLS